MQTAFDKKFRRLEMAFFAIFLCAAVAVGVCWWSIFNSLNMIANDPATIGRAAGEIVKGYRETVKETLP